MPCMSLRACTGTATLASILALMLVVFTARAATTTPSAASLVWLKAGQYARLDAHYTKLQRDYEAGRMSDVELLKGARELYEDVPANAAHFDAWVRAFPHSYVAQTARGAYYYRMAWAARGTE